MMDAQLANFTNNFYIVHLKWMNYMLCETCLN